MHCFEWIITKLTEWNTWCYRSTPEQR